VLDRLRRTTLPQLQSPSIAIYNAKALTSHTIEPIRVQRLRMRARRQRRPRQHMHVLWCDALAPLQEMFMSLSASAGMKQTYMMRTDCYVQR